MNSRMNETSEWFKVEMDSHADTCCVGRDVLIVNETMKTVKVTSFLKSLGTVNKIPIVSAAIAYDDPKSGNVIILIIHQALHFHEMSHCLLCPMQMRLNDITINERPKFLTNKPREEDHAIVIDQLIIPLELHGITSYFPGRKPTKEEYDKCQRIELTAPDPEWKPYDERFSEEEASYINIDGSFREETVNVCEIEIHNEEKFLERLKRSIMIVQRQTDDDVQISSITSRAEMMAAEQLCKTWGIGLNIAQKTIAVTTQRGVKTVVYPNVERRWPTGDRPLRYKRINHKVFHDTLYSNMVSARGNKCCELYATEFGWSRNFPMLRESEVHETLNLFLSRYGIPEALVSDGAKSYQGGRFRKTAREAGCFCKVTDPYSPWQNRAEGEIREVKRLAGRWMVKSRSPRKLWDHCLELSSLVRSHTAHDMYQLNGQVPETIMMGQTADISFICEFAWYAWVFFNESNAKFPDNKVCLGRYLGPTDPEAGSVLTAKILKSNGEVIRRNTFRHLTKEEFDNDDNRRERERFSGTVEKRMGEPVDDIDLEKQFGISAVTPEYEVYQDDRVELSASPCDDVVESHNPTTQDGYTSAQVSLPKGEGYMLGTVMKRKLDGKGNLIGKSNDNPILDTRLYEVEFADGETLEYAANVIAENLYSQVDSEGRRHVIMDSIVDHKKDDSATSKDEAFSIINGKRVRNQSTKGWKLCVQWKDSSTSWESLRNLKESNPVEVAEYAVAQNIDSEPAFIWWVPFTLRRRDRIIAAVNNRYLLRSHKFGIELPKSVESALRIDKATGTTHWKDAIDLEIRNVDVAFQDLDHGEDAPPGYQFVKCHIIFDIKAGSLKRKARYVAGGHMTEPPAANTYASVVSRESVRLGLMIAALNDLQVLSADIQNAYLTSPCQEKIYTILGPEFGPHRQGCKALVVRALYGLKSAGASFRNHLASCLSHLGYESSKGDVDVWYRPATKVTGEEYYEYLFVYTDDILAIGIDPINILTRLNRYFKLKPDSIHPPDDYLGTKIKLTTLPNGASAWGQSSSHYVLNAVKNLEEWMVANEYKLPKKASTPMSTSYRPELDVSPTLDAKLANYYQSLIGVLRWAVEIGRIDITTEVSMLAAHMAMPREGHLYAVFRVFAYLKLKHNSRLIYDATCPKVDINDFKANVDWTPFYGKMKEALPPNAPKPRGRSVVLRMFVDSDHAGDRLTRRSRTGYIQMVNMAPIAWYSKKQGSVEAATFGSEFVALRTGIESNRALRYKLRMMGIPIDGPTFVYCDNMSVVYNTTLPESTLKKKSNSIAFHAVREAAAMKEILISYINTLDNVADIMTKTLPSGEKRDKLVQGLMWDIT